eukprot:NODE_10677_length_1336_cov_3.125724.p1 GENE.NODE_10677_length_1336_cov_3.125724~~NODE_10677_length_1336_cov_3.125724.p1  ORF type:complete len:410 (+),score=100.63 NODE_10677_length_1336_cov_3.125724:14-1243(+)
MSGHGSLAIDEGTQVFRIAAVDSAIAGRVGLPTAVAAVSCDEAAAPAMLTAEVDATVGPVADPGRMRDAGYCEPADITALWEQKARLDSLFDSGGNRSYKRARDELFSPAAAAQLGNRAGDKLAEVAEAVRLPSFEAGAAFLDVCGAPGAWSRFLYKLAERDGVSLRGFGMSLREGTNPLSCTWYNDLLARTDFTPLWGADGTGNVCSAANIAQAAAASGRVAAVIADGWCGAGAGDGHLENYQEILVGRLLLSETLLMLETLQYGGTFICKIFDTFAHLTAGLIFTVATLFEEVFVVKPVHSRVVNSERYLVGKCFGGPEHKYFAALRHVVQTAHAAWPAPGADGPWSGLAPLAVVAPTLMAADTAFFTSVQSMATSLCRRQVNALKLVTDRALELERGAPAKRRRTR